MKYLFGTGLLGVVSATFALIKGSEGQKITWRTVLAWLSWGISVAYVIGSIADLRREEQGLPTPAQSAAEKRAQQQLAKRLSK